MNLKMEEEYVVKVVYQHLYPLAVHVGFYGEVVECLISDPAA